MSLKNLTSLTSFFAQEVRGEAERAKFVGNYARQLKAIKNVAGMDIGNSINAREIGEARRLRGNCLY